MAELNLESMATLVGMARGLDSLAEMAGFRNIALSKPEGVLIQSKRPIYWLLQENGELAIFIFEDRTRPETAKLYIYTAEELSRGVNLKEDTPVFTGVDAVVVLSEYQAIFGYGR